LFVGATASSDRGARVAALAGLHSLVDFSLQIPYSIVALSLIGAGLAQSFPTEGQHDPRAGAFPETDGS